MRVAVFLRLSKESCVEHGRIGEDGRPLGLGEEGSCEHAPGEFGLVHHRRDNVLGAAYALVKGATM